MEKDVELLTISEAANLLKISAVTLHRWIKQGRLPAYRAGPRKLRISRHDLGTVLIPAHEEGLGKMKDAIKPLTEERVQQALEAMKEADAVIQAIRERRKGVPLASSAPLIRKARDERSKQLL